MRTLTDTQAQALARVEAGLISGHYFMLIAQSLRSVRTTYGGGHPPITHREWAKIMQAVARFAAIDDRRAAVAREIFGKVNLYATRYEAAAQVAEVLYQVTQHDYEDVIGRSGPEGGRPSQYVKPHDLRAGIWLALLMNEVQAAIGEGAHLGWCLDLLQEREGGFWLHVNFPAAYEAKGR